MFNSGDTYRLKRVSKISKTKKKKKSFAIAESNENKTKQKKIILILYSDIGNTIERIHFASWLSNLEN